uniref:Uncharacterized protein n=1 Tax=Romanomermis culicivorax TaxID=13658 RepID=A0A915KJK5_ROMCU
MGSCKRLAFDLKITVLTSDPPICTTSILELFLGHLRFTQKVHHAENYLDRKLCTDQNDDNHKLLACLPYKNDQRSTARALNLQKTVILVNKLCEI